MSVNENRIEPSEARRAHEEQGAMLVDVRGFDECAAVHAAGATLSSRLAEVPSSPFVVMCGSGYRSSIASSLLQ